jgi:hypothetical protein
MFRRIFTSCHLVHISVTDVFQTTADKILNQKRFFIFTIYCVLGNFYNTFWKLTISCIDSVWKKSAL